MTEKVQGSVKWFSNRKGYGFITPADGSSITDDIFVHQSSILCEGYRTLDEGWEVEFEIDHDDDGKAKAVSVTSPGGGPCFGPRKLRPSNRRRTGAVKHGVGGGGGGEEIGKVKEPAKPKVPFWHDFLDDSVKTLLDSKNIRKNTGTIDVSAGHARVKLGTNGYSSVAHSSGLLAEGLFTCDVDGNVAMTWEHCIVCANELWAATEDKSSLPTAFNLKDATVLPVKANETAQTLWGDLPDPKEALAVNGFQMRHVVLTPRRRR